MIQDVEYAALKREEIFLEILLILSNFKLKKTTILAIFIEKLVVLEAKIHENLKKIEIYSLVLQIDYPVALCFWNIVILLAHC